MTHTIHRYFGFALMLISLYSPLTWADVNLNRSQEKSNIRQFFNNYMVKYNHYLTTKEFNKLPALYADTIMVMSSSVEPYVIDANSFYERTQKFLDNLQKKGVQKVGWLDINVHLIDKNLAVASNLAARYDKNDDEYNRVGVTYLLRKRNSEWRITSFTVHNADGVIQLMP